MKANLSKILGCVLVLTLVAACAPKIKSNSLPSPTLTRPASSAKLAFIEPLQGAKFSSETVRVKLSLEGATIVPSASTNIQPDKGHIHLALDGKVISMTFGLEQGITAAKGKHILTAEFVASDHAPFNPRVTTTTTFEVL